MGKFATIVAAVVALVGMIPSLLILFTEGESMEKWVEISILITEAALFLSVLAAIGSAIKGLTVNPKGIRQVLIGMGLLVVLVGLTYAFASGADFEQYTKIRVTESGSRWISTGLNTTYIMMLASVGAVAFSIVYRLRK